jgi:Ran GTPase-activating protein (RanGAP) involved in mRNA processing and transport
MAMATLDEPTVLLTLELTGDTSEKDVSIRHNSSIKRVQTDAKNIKFIVSMPRLVDAEQANLTADLLFEEIDRLPMIAVVERVTLNGLRFTSEGVAGIIMFLTIHASTVKHVVLNDIFSGVVVAREDPNALYSLASAFEASKLVSLNLSNNIIGGWIWKNWIQQRELQQLILDHVEMNEASLQALASNFVFGHTLRDLHVVLNNRMRPAALDAANTILKSCTKLGALRWVNKTEDTKLPWLGLQSMAAAMSTNNSGKLSHLVMEGGCLSDEDLSCKGLCGALLVLPSLQTLKLRHVGMRDAAVQRIVAAMRSSRPQLECLDFSYNAIQSEGAKALVELVHIPRVTKNLTSLVLEKNLIANDGAISVISTFGSKVGAKLDLRLRGNPFDYGKISFELAVSKGSVEVERDVLRKECDRLRAEANDARQNLRKVMAAQTLIVSDMHILQQESERVTEERETLSKAFSVLGKVQQVEERKQMLCRIGKLEEMVLGHGTTATTSLSSPKRSKQPKPNGNGRRGEIRTLSCDRLSFSRHTTSMPSIGEGETLALNTSNSNSNEPDSRPIIKRASSLDNSKHNHHSPQRISPINRLGSGLQRATSERWGSIGTLKVTTASVSKGSPTQKLTSPHTSSPPFHLSPSQVRAQSLMRTVALARVEASLPDARNHVGESS